MNPVLAIEAAVIAALLGMLGFILCLGAGVGSKREWPWILAAFTSLTVGLGGAFAIVAVTF